MLAPILATTREAWFLLCLSEVAPLSSNLGLHLLWGLPVVLGYAFAGCGSTSPAANEPCECCDCCDLCSSEDAAGPDPQRPPFSGPEAGEIFQLPPVDIDSNFDAGADGAPADGTADTYPACAPLTAPVHCVQGHCVDEPPVACIDGGWFCLMGSAACYDDGGAAD